MAFFKELWIEIRQTALGRVVLLSVVVGIVAAFGALLFDVLLDGSKGFFMERGAGYVMPEAHGHGEVSHFAPPQRRVWLFFIPAVGGLLSGLVVYTFAPEAEGHGTDALIEAFHRKRGIIRKRVPLVKTIASVLTIGSGGSAGREGPIAQIGGGFGSAVASWLKLSDRERRILMLAGAGAGLGAVFRAPLGGALFAVEVLYRDIEFESSALAPTFIASITAYSLYCGLTGTWGAIFDVPPMQFTHLAELPLYVLLGVGAALMGILYVQTFYGIRNKIFRPLRIANYLKPSLGGLALGVIGYFLPEVLGMGYGWVQLALDGNLPLKLALTIALVKMVATGLSIGSGGSGGIFAPSVAIGACFGSAVGSIFHQWLPDVVTQPASFVLVGMAGFFSGVAKTPVSTLIMVSEMTTGYGLLVPLMLATAVGYLVTPRRISIYDRQVDARIDSPAHEGEFVVDVLEQMKVREILKREELAVTFRSDTRLHDILEAVAETSQHVYPVLDAKDQLMGVINFDDIRVFFTEKEIPQMAIVAQDLLAAAFTAVQLEEDLSSALRKFRQTRLEELPVVTSEADLSVLGVIGRRDVIAAYHDRMYRTSKS